MNILILVLWIVVLLVIHPTELWSLSSKFSVDATEDIPLLQSSSLSYDISWSMTTDHPPPQLVPCSTNNDDIQEKTAAVREALRRTVLGDSNTSYHSEVRSLHCETLSKHSRTDSVLNRLLKFFFFPFSLKGESHVVVVKEKVFSFSGRTLRTRRFDNVTLSQDSQQQPPPPSRQQSKCSINILIFSEDSATTVDVANETGNGNASVLLALTINQEQLQNNVVLLTQALNDFLNTSIDALSVQTNNHTAIDVMTSSLESNERLYGHAKVLNSSEGNQTSSQHHDDDGDNNNTGGIALQWWILIVVVVSVILTISVYCLILCYKQRRMRTIKRVHVTPADATSAVDEDWFYPDSFKATKSIKSGRIPKSTRSRMSFLFV
eukprot:scaffold1462_cov168-Ochromonas_danica.AAC.3